MYVGIAAGSGFLLCNALGIPMLGRRAGVMLDGSLRKWFWGTQRRLLARAASRART